MLINNYYYYKFVSYTTDLLFPDEHTRAFEFNTTNCKFFVGEEGRVRFSKTSFNLKRNYSLAILTFNIFFIRTYSNMPE